MEEIKTFLEESSEQSLAILDELGRGTSTYDGIAIAYSTLKFIAEKIKCYTLFSTHYHNLIEEFKLYDDTIKNYYMDFNVNDDKIEFYYKFKEGFINKSFGFHVAKLANIPVYLFKFI